MPDLLSLSTQHYEFGESNIALKTEPIASFVDLLNPPPAAMTIIKPRPTIIIPPTIDTTSTLTIIHYTQIKIPAPLS